MRILGLDSAARGCSVALWQDGCVVAAREGAQDRGQAEALVPLVVAVMADAGVSFADLDGIAVTVGPGSFTGVRVGLAAARGLALAADRPVIGVTSTEVVAHGVVQTLKGRGGPAAGDPPAAVVVALESFRADVYVQAFAEDLCPRTPVLALVPDEVADHLPPGALWVGGDAGARLLPFLGPRAVLMDEPAGGRAASAAALAAERSRRGTAGSVAAEPLYLRPADVTLPEGAVGGSCCVGPAQP